MPTMLCGSTRISSLTLHSIFTSIGKFPGCLLRTKKHSTEHFIFSRGMRFENVSSLIEALAPEAGSMGFHWRDSNGSICNQKSVFRVNCMDCLDRTNVVQTALGKAVLESQLVKLGLAPPYSQLPEQLKVPFMILWANNGDVISRQYAGTNALKASYLFMLKYLFQLIIVQSYQIQGDYTRTGERKISGIMKDGMNSANR